ncbi:hypothetical protein BH10BDE1_BH10BDE1_23530 [soil metagenome]
MNLKEEIRNVLRMPPTDALIPIGRAQGFLGRKEWITNGQLNHHVHIVGASGFGKTVLLMHIIRTCIREGRGLLFVDLKGDRETLEELTATVEAANRSTQLKVFSLNGHQSSCSYNLIGNGSATELRDRIMQSLVWSEEYYQNQSASFLLKLLIGLCWLRDNAKLSLDLALILQCAKDPEKIEELLLLIPETQGHEWTILDEARKFLKGSDNFNSIQGLRTQLESIVLSDFGKSVRGDENGLDLFQTVRDGKIAFVFLDTRRFGATAAAVGRFLIQDLKSVSGRIDAEVRKSDRRPFTVIIDEFADLAQEDFIGFLDRARSSRIGIVVAHQEISDLDRISPEFCGRLMGNTATLFAFLQKRPESAELICGIAGTRRVKVVTHQFETKFYVRIPTGMQSEKEVDEFIVHPNVVKSLGVGECVVVGKYPRKVSKLLKISRIELTTQREVL